MTKPKRVLLSRRKGSKLPPNTVVVARPSRWGNPYKLGDYKVQLSSGTVPMEIGHARAMAVRDFEAWIRFCDSGEPMRKAAVEELRGKHLACWCPLDAECHADILLEIANAPLV